MGVFESSTVSVMCLSNLHCLELVKKHVGNSVRETASFTLGLISVIVWVVAQIPQIITNYRAKSTEGLSVTFLVTWIIGDLFNLFGCLLEPATLYTIITVALGAQSIYYGHIYPQLKNKRQHKDSKNENAEQSNESDDSNRDTGPCSQISVPACPQRISAEGELFYHSETYLSKSQTLTTGSILAPALKIKNTLCLVSTLTFIGGINLFQSLDRRTNPTVSTPRQEFVIYVGRKLFQVGGDQSAENGASGSIGIGTFLGWIMTFMYLGGRLPQICLNIKRGHVEGLNPLMFLLALIGNASYVASILVINLDWSRIRPNLPWLVDAGGCAFLDFFASRVITNIRPLLHEEETGIFTSLSMCECIKHFGIGTI
ncbi:hypothetical protein RIF29_05322 [Crotalaria pallida]|uniref:Uncharacterized protein n=1 Tax=Crotalaria pallida TaxID=3830 RepID=A0AAN9J1W8_CROPI